ncbi:hypothetical protein TRM7557_02056 [Tritonibacter multivorans]|uniref:Uncharacterized protein n=1 Tax=Tritonibacter multivorans TaxID=928856 RepID=A0A0P1GUM2_9RHOB|nr:hypothetical protein TRM7557_02056 [Tritonibacter multivorans]SFD29120.1 hypothetical protein SAMN04488049_110130 [Tritonibacter multivorans]
MANAAHTNSIANQTRIPKARKGDRRDLQTQVAGEDDMGSDRERRALSKLVDYAIECARDNNFREARQALMEARESLRNAPSAADTREVHFTSRFAKRRKSSLTRT